MIVYEIIILRGYPSELTLGVRPQNERRRYFVTTSPTGWAPT